MNKIYVFILLILFSSCGTKINYIGNSYSSTDKVDLFVDDNSIGRPYKIIGKGYPDYITLGRRSIESIQRKATEKAREKGADAILIQDYLISETPSSLHSVYRTDSIGKGLITVGNTTVTHTNTTGFIIFFLKYTDR